MRIAYFWLTMGHYHFARMEAISRLKNVELHVIEATNLDDHFWERSETSKSFTHHLLHKGQVLDHKLTGSSWKKINAKLKEINPDVFVNGAGYFHPQSFIALSEWKKKSTGKLVLWSESTERDQPRKFYKEFIKKQTLKIYDGAIVAGQDHKSYLEKLKFSSDKIQVVGNVVNNSFFENKTPSTQRKGILFVGRLLEIKNVDFLLKAYKKYQNQVDNPEQLIIVGDGPEKEFLEDFTQKNEIKNVSFEGNLQIDEVQKLYNASRFFVLPSKSEPWGLVVNEAMAAGLPVLVSQKCGCAGELVKHQKNGYIIQVEDTEDLTEKLLELHNLDQKKYDSMSDASRDIISNFTPDTYAAKCEFLFNKI